MKNEDINMADLACSFQDSVVKVLTDKTMKAATDNKVKQIVVAGGCAANKGLRLSMANAVENTGIELVFPKMKYCTDNAAMIAIAGWFHYQNGERTSLDVAPVSRLAEF